MLDRLSRRTNVYIKANGRYKRPASIALFVALFAGIGLLAVALSGAASFVLAGEAESGTRDGAASVVADSAASGGSAVRFASATTPPSQTPTMTAVLSANTKYQTIDGFGVSINAHSWNNGELKPALDMLVDQNGSKIFRVVMEMTDWEAANDNTDPASFNWNYYNPIYSGTNFEEVWSTIDYLKQKGVPANNIALSFMGIGPSWLGGATVSQAQEDEWVEMVTSAAYYGYVTRGATFGIFAPDNEEDWGHNEGIVMSAAQYARAMNKVGQRLDALGMGAVKLGGPETADVCSGAGAYWTAMTAYPALMAKVDHLMAHDYGGSTCNAVTAIKNSSYPGKNLWMTEFSIFDQAFSLLDQNASGLLMWDAYDSVYNHAILNGLGSNPGNDAGNAPALIAYNASSKTYTPRKSFYQFGQLFKWVTPGMQMVKITSSNGDVDLYAFAHPTTGAITIVGQNNSSTTQVIGGTLQNIPTATTLHFTRTTSSLNMSAGSDVSINGNSFTAPVPANSVFTLTTL